MNGDQGLARLRYEKPDACVIRCGHGSNNERENECGDVDRFNILFRFEYVREDPRGHWRP